MYPLTIGLAVENKDLWDQTQAALAELPFHITVEQRDTGAWEGFIDRLDRMHPDVVLLDISRHDTPIEDVVTAIRAVLGDAMIVALDLNADAETILASLRAGVNEFLHPPLDAALRRSLEKRAAERGRRRDGAKGGGKSFAFFSAKGGCGATTLACHVASDLGHRNQKVLLADFDIDAGMIGFLTKIDTPYSIMDAVNNLHRLDMSYWKAIVSAGMPGVEIIPSPTALASRQAPRDDQLRHVLGFVRPYYDWTIVDFGRSLTRLTMAALEEIDEACLVTTLEIPALHQAKQIVQALLDSGYGKNRIRLVLNRVPKRVDITPPELEKMMGLPIFAMIADDFAELYEAYAEGRLLARSSSLGKQIGRFGAKLAGLENGNGKKRFALFG